ncbi:MAG: iron-sulfur cluster assembly scaffold protein, partial [Candidatus Bathyarchaeia archaeon]
KYKTQGCAASVACGSVLTELVKDKTIEEALKITKDDIVTALNGLPQQKIHCSVLADDALKDAIRDYFSKNNLPVPQELIEKHEKIKPLIEDMKQKGYILI